MYYLGIDGGGTKTAFAVMNENKDILATYKTTGSYFPVLGAEGLFDILNEGILKVTKGYDLSKVVACAGIPMYGESETLDDVMVDIGKRLPVKAIFFNDVEVGYYGALGFEPGINVVSGTGSIAIGFDESGKVARSGGFGPELEGDEGSGHYVGRRLLNQFTRQVDLRQERTMLYEALVEHFNLKKDIYLFGTLMDTGGLERDKMASLSRLAAELAQKGDPVCLQIFEDTTCELELLTLALERQLNFEKRPIKVSYSGGMFAAKELILEPLSKKLEKHDMILVEPKYEPVYGACLRAMKIYP